MGKSLFRAPIPNSPSGLQEGVCRGCITIINDKIDAGKKRMMSDVLEGIEQKALQAKVSHS